ncbi:putative monooxygenase (luciferase-like) [Actinoplanes lobatus]|uniref:Alkanesulfonate monooxygenase SsuD/methylene tetrahydromethanopterin reductase-like flavin-dependent oxidoreductase (Luciferase family) n=1 Tax=Actinoplanes lobatus TaxID=113568 RepID=A0A7W7HHL0_9ACTN|nr:LLM class flavin-dependent oxidoreductase [Actinoplanes lobatus]MBB4750695.1 alkanesulfonate monooxygenase SsuD/methylene tetrahydromethanopterin reductase-like flavin-dependent oxidoreductase (luciferase family) [Actinoplanes lobatus]GGN69052.1 putative monooxygenase (luciferase-like) [Actinoplanes lobatus]GIE42135.1 putative monooxygenase (luciferase-like) [Actinoplanes lobatus]
MPVPLSILDLAPLVSGGDVTDALRRTLDLARRAEQFGYHRYWVAEHHFTPGVASSQPALLLGQIAAVTDRIRLGSGAVQTGFQTALSIVEQFGLLDALHPGRFDLGLGRSGQAKKEALRLRAEEKPQQEERVVDGLLIPKPFSWAPIFASKRTAFASGFLYQPGAEPLGLTEILDQIDALLAGPVTDDEGNEVVAVPGAGADLEVWLLGSSGGESARTAGARGLPFAANYHVAPAKVLEAAEAYRESFVPTAARPRPHLMVSADVLVAEDDETARRLARPFAVWVHSIRTGLGAVPFPSIEEASLFEWTDQDRALVADRVTTQFVGSPQTVAERLETLRRVTGADELLVTTIAHDHADRVRSYELLAKEWSA